MFVCFLQVCLAWKTISCLTDKGNRLKHVQFSQGVPVWRMYALWCIVHKYYDFLNLFISKGAGEGLGGGVKAPAVLSLMGARVPEIRNVSILSILTKK